MKTILALGVLFLVGPFLHLVNATEYTFTDLGTLGGTWSEAYGLNQSGEVGGMATLADGSRRAALWSASHVISELPPLAGASLSGGHAINDDGDVVGFSLLPSGAASHATLWRDSQPPIDLGTLPDYRDSSAYGINALGQVVGNVSAHTTTGYTRGFVYLPNAAYGLPSGMHMLFPLASGGKSSFAEAIRGGLIVGGSGTAVGSHATLWEHGSVAGFTPRDLGTLGGRYSYATDVNDAGLVVGTAEITSGQKRAFLWSAIPDPSGTMYDLGTLGYDSIAKAINNRGQIVGEYDGGSSFYRHAFIWENDVMTDLNDFLPPGYLWVLEHAYGINDAGQIVGVATIGPETHGFLMTPVPEPTSLLLAVSAGLLGAVVVFRRRSA